MKAAQVHAMAAAIAAEVVDRIDAAYIQRRNKRRPWAWLDTQLTEIRDSATADIVALCRLIASDGPVEDE